MPQQNSSEAGLHLAPIRAAYFQRVRNSGDAIAPYLLANIAGRPTVSARSTDLPYLLSIGSVIHTSTPSAFVWGTGLIHPSAGTGNPDARRILAVRGKLTHAELVRNGLGVGDVPLGDPGMLISRLLPQQRAGTPPFPLGLVPYVFDRDHPFFLDAAKNPDIKVIDVCDPVDVYLADVMSCAAIASSSLHGLVFGEALGLPTLWLEGSDKVVGGRFKFDDWFSLAGNPQREPVRPKTFASVAEIIGACEPRQIEIDQGALLQAITSEVVEECSRPAPQQRAIIPVSVCRVRPLPVFILSYNRPNELKRMIASLRGQDRPIEIAICDDGSDDLETLAVLGSLERSGIWVHRRRGDNTAEYWQRVNCAIDAFFRNWSEPSRYAVTGCDVDLSTSDMAALDLYDDLLDRFPRADSIGPALADTRQDRQGAETIINARTSRASALSAWQCIVLDGGFDPGFAVYRAGKPLSATMKSLRVIAPH